MTTPKSTPKPEEILVAGLPAQTSPGCAHKPAIAQSLDSQALFQGAQEVQITHRGSVYRLRQTSQGKLLLTK